MKPKLVARKKPDEGDSQLVIGRRIREARELSGLSGPQLAVFLGISRSALSQMELGKSGMTINVLERLARHLQTSPEWLRYGVGNGPRIPRPVMVPEINVEHVSFELSELMQYRTEREWAVPLSEAHRMGLTEHKLIAIRVNEAIPPEFKAGDVVVLDLAANQFNRRGYYALILDDRCVLCLVSKSASKFEATIGTQTITANSVKVLGTVVYCFRGSTNFLLPATH